MPSLLLYDTHAHLTDEAFTDSLDEVIAAARQAGVSQINVIGFDASSSRRACELATRYPDYLHASVGIQPNSVAAATEGDWEVVESLVSHQSVRAIGETGLDLYWDDTPLRAQQDAFERQIAWAHENSLPLVIHMRESGQLIVEQLAPHARKGAVAGVMHSFSGDWELCKNCLDLGLYISFAGMVTFKKSSDLRGVAAKVPIDRILIETDCPYLSPEPFRGRRPNQPARVEHTLRCLAEVRGERSEDLARVTTANALRLFHKTASPTNDV